VEGMERAVPGRLLFFFGSMMVEVPDTDSDSEFEKWIM
jgi:hypothetical protein